MLLSSLLENFVPFSMFHLQKARPSQERARSPLIHIDWSRIAVFSFKTLAWTSYPLTHPLALDWGSRWMWLEEQVFCSGSTR